MTEKKYDFADKEQICLFSWVAQFTFKNGLCVV